MRYVNDVRELIGKTPTIKLNNMGIKTGVNIFAKLECFNPAGSVKDRIGLSMIKKAEEYGLLKPGSTIVEATAGNTGLGVALAALNRGYKVIFIVPEKFSLEKQVLMRALGAEIINTPKDKGMKGAMEKVGELLETINDAITLQQFENPQNPQIHYETTGPEIYSDLEGGIDYFIAGAGSGGTFSGIARYLKKKDSRIKAMLADPVGSTMGGGEEGCYFIEGIGNNFVPGTMDMGLVDGVIKVNDDEAVFMVKELARKEGLIVGSSSGAAMAAAIKLSERIGSGNIATVFPDRGDRYFSKNLYY